MSKAEIIDTPAGPAQLKRTRRKTLSISVLPDGTLELTAPEHATVEAVLARVEKRLRWIRQQRRGFSEMNATRPARRYVNGATHRYLGRQYRLKVLKGEEASVKLREGYFHITSQNGSAAEVEKLLAAWMRDRASEQFDRRVAQWSLWCARHHLPKPRLILRFMPKRWGSAHTDGRIALNPELVHASSACIDYVIAHEICHLKHPHHGPEFFRLLNTLFPSWRAVKSRLEASEA
jgi:predicted metal-dependent hydrolase